MYTQAMILHVDMDAFYASVEERDRPEIRGQAVIVGGSPDARGVVSAANYEARRFGVHSAMPTRTAYKLCPHAVFVRPRMDRYASVSRQIREIFHRFTPLVEPLSLDEAFLDVAGSVELFGEPAEIGQRIKLAIREELNLVASVGGAPNKFVAKIASDLDKPDGFVIVPAQDIQDFLDPLPISRLWGVGKASAKVFARFGIERIEQLRQLSVDVLREQFGKQGDHFWRLAHGLDRRRVVPDQEAKSISHETTFSVDVEDLEVLRSWLMQQTEQVARRLRRHGLKGRTVQLKLRYADFSTITRSVTLPQPTDLTNDIWANAAEMLANRLPKRHLSVRLLGVGVTAIESSSEAQPLLFQDEERERLARLDTVTDEIRDKFGGAAVNRGIGMRKKR